MDRRRRGGDPHLTAADATLADSLGRVADESVRDALGAAIDAVRTMLPEPAGGSAAPTATSTGGSATDAADLAPSSPEDLRDAVAAMTAATAAVTAAQLAWQAEQDALAAQQEAARQEAARRESQEPALGGPPSTGAGPDCGGPGSYEPPKNEGPTFYTSTPGTDGDGSNGRIPASQMTSLGWCTDSQGNQQWLRSDAAAALTRLNEAFRAEFSENIAVDLSYRSYEDQVEMREAYGSVAARPGTSNHGTGTAIDTWEWAAYSFGSARYEWLVTHGPEHGWVAPDWARQGGSNPEYWHFEFVG